MEQNNQNLNTEMPAAPQAEIKPAHFGKLLYEMSMMQALFPFIGNNPKKRRIPEVIGFHLIFAYLMTGVISCFYYALKSIPNRTWKEYFILLDLFDRHEMFLIMTAIMGIFVGWVFIGYIIKYFAFPIKINKDFIKRFVKKYLWQICFTALLVWVFISTVKCGSPTAFTGDTGRMEGFFAILGYCAVFICAQLVRTEKKRNILIKTFAIVTTMIAILMIGQYFKWPILVELGYNTSYMVGIFANSNHMGYLLCMCVAVNCVLMLACKRLWEKLFYGILFVLSVYATIQNDTLGCYLAVIFGMLIIVFYLIFGLKKNVFISIIPMAIMLAIAIGVSLFPNSKFGTDKVTNNMSSLFGDLGKLVSYIGNGSEDKQSGESEATDNSPNVSDIDSLGTARLGLWRYCLIFISQKPILGWGPDQLIEPYENSDLRRPSARPHNEYLQCAGFYGIPALLLYLAGLIVLAVRQINKMPVLQVNTVVAIAGVTCYLISAFFGCTMYYTFPYFMILLGLASCAELKKLPQPAIETEASVTIEDNEQLQE